MSRAEEGESASRPVHRGHHSGDLDPDLPVDKGWAWVILISISMIFALSFGYLRAYGILFVEFLAKFQASSSVTALIMGTQAVCVSFGSFLTMNVGMSFFHIRTLESAGGFIAFLGVLFTTFAPNMSALIVFQGVFIGLGCSLMQGPSITILNQYFNKRRAMATSTAATGGTMGAVLIPLFMRFLLDHYGLDGAVLIFSGVVLNSLIFSFLLRPMDDYKRRSRRRRQRQMALRELDANGHTRAAEANLVETVDDVEASPSSRLLGQGGSEVKTIFSPQEGASTVHEVSDENFPQRWDLSGKRSTDEVTFSSTKSERKVLDGPAESAVERHPSLPDVHADFSSSAAEKTPDLATLDSPANMHVSDRVAVTTNSPAGNEEKEAARPPLCTRIRTSLVRSLDFGLLKRPVVWVLFLHCMLGFQPALLMVIYLPALAAGKGISKPDAALLLSINGAVTIVSRPLVGCVADLLQRRRQYLANGFLFACCVVGMFTHFYNSFEALVALSVLHGVFGSIFVPMMSVLMVDALGVQKLTKAFGFNMLFQGLFTAAVHPLCGFLGDVTGSYDAVFIFLSSLGFVAVVILLLLPCAERLERKAEKDTG